MYGYGNLGELLQIEAADMTGDGHPDIVLLLANVYNALVILMNNLQGRRKGGARPRIMLRPAAQLVLVHRPLDS